MYWSHLGALKFVRFRPCLIRPKASSGFQIRILKPWSCKGKHWIQVLFHGNKCKIWIWFLTRRRNLLSDENAFGQYVEFIQCYIPQPFYDQITDYELIAIFKFPLPLVTLSFSAILNPIILPPIHLTVPTTHWSSTSHWFDDPLVCSP